MADNADQMAEVEIVQDWTTWWLINRQERCNGRDLHLIDNSY